MKKVECYILGCYKFHNQFLGSALSKFVTQNTLVFNSKIWNYTYTFKKTHTHSSRPEIKGTEKWPNYQPVVSTRYKKH